MTRPSLRVATRVVIATLLAVSGALVALPASADTSTQTLPFTQNWTNTGLITTNDDWSGVPGVTGFLGDGLTAVNDVDPQTVLAEGTGAVDAIANQTTPNTLTAGGVAEFQITDPVVALQGSGTADAPFINLYLNTTGLTGITVAYNLRDIDGSIDNAAQQVALQYRVGSTGNYTNVPTGYVADATTGPSLATLVTPVLAVLPAAVDNQSHVEVRVITTNATGSDEWVGIDDINVSTGDAAPSVSATNPTNGQNNVALASNIGIDFSESVTLSGVTISGSSSGSHTSTVSASPATSFTVNPDSDFVNSETVTVTVPAANVTDTDASDPPDNMAADYIFSFQTVPADTAPSVSSTTPTNGAGQVPLNSNITVNFSESVHVTSSWLTINGSVSGAHTYTYDSSPSGNAESIAWVANPDSDFVASETVTVTVVANQVGDTDVTDPPDNMAANYVFSFGTPISIHDVQGATHTSPFAGQFVAGVPGIITAKRINGFYMQEASPDANDATSEGIFVFTSSAPTQNVGDSVSVSGTVSEFRPGGASSVSLTVTELVAPLTIIVNSSGNPLPAPTVAGTGGRVPPNGLIEDDATGNVETSGVFDPAQDGIDFWETLEFMRVQINDAHVVGPTSDFGSNREVPVVGDNGANATILTPRGGILLRQTDNNSERIILNDLIVGGPMLATTVDVNDSYPGATVGVLDYNFNNFKLEITSIPPLVSGGLTGEVTTDPGTDEVSIGSFNVENLDPGDPAQKFTDLANQIVVNMKSPDIIAIEELQDNNGATNDSTTDASVTLNLLISAIQTAGGPTYSYRQIDPVDDQDGGEPGGNIRVAFMFRTDRGVAFVDRPGGSPTTNTTIVNNGGVPELSSSPGRIEPTNSAFNASRKPLAGEFTYNGRKIFVVANHWNSKGGDNPLWGRFQPPVLSSETQRNNQAQIVNNFVDAILAVDSSANIVVLGDLNDFTWSTPLATLTAGGVLEDLVLTLPEAERYSYVFEGNTQELDHLLSSQAMSDDMTLYDAIHVNAEFAPQVSDHDPLVALFSFPTAPPLTCTQTGGPGPDTLNGTPGPDHICGMGGDDIINGLGGNDILEGGGGADQLNGGDGDDLIKGGAGIDTINAGNDDDTIDAGTDNDVVNGGAGNDELLGKKGLDDLEDTNGTDELKGGFGNDMLDTADGVGGDNIDGGKGASDVCSADPGDTVVKCP